MLQFNEKGIPSLYPYKVKYTQKDETIEKWALPSKEWWIETQKKWSDEITIHEFKEVKLSPEEIQRFENVKDYIVDGLGFETYIRTGEFPRGILGVSEEIEQKIMEYNQRIYEEKDETVQDRLIQERKNIIPRPTLEEMISFVKKEFNK